MYIYIYIYTHARARQDRGAAASRTRKAEYGGKSVSDSLASGKNKLNNLHLGSINPLR